MKRQIPISTFIVAALLMTGPAAAYDYLPLDQGFERHLASTGDPDSTVTIAVDGTHETLPIVWMTVEHQGVFSSRSSRWTAEYVDDGDIFIHHMDPEQQGAFLEISPPVPLIDAPLYAGKTWSADWQALGQDFHSDLTVVAEGEMEFGGQTLYTYVLEHAQSGYWTITSYFWFVDGVGIVRVAEGTYFDARWEAPVPVRASTLSLVKDLFR